MDVYDTLEKIFEKLAFITWDTVGQAYSNRILFGEDAITSVNLLALKNERTHTLVIEDTRVDEHNKGCDFEFWIGSKTKGWFRYAIQAKKITVSNQRYDSLSHKVGGIPQISILETYANLNQAIPLYCLFNHSLNALHYQPHCPKYKNVKELGCSITPLSTAKTALDIRGARNFHWFHNRSETLPWSCLIRCPNISQHWPKSQVGFDYNAMNHEQIPHELELLFNREYAGDQLIDSKVFSSETNCRPRWVGIFNTLEEDING
jgi:hypothetical protein